MLFAIALLPPLCSSFSPPCLLIPLRRLRQIRAILLRLSYFAAVIDFVACCRCQLLPPPLYAAKDIAFDAAAFVTPMLRLLQPLISAFRAAQSATPLLRRATPHFDDAPLRIFRFSPH